MMRWGEGHQPFMKRSILCHHWGLFHVIVYDSAIHFGVGDSNLKDNTSNTSTWQRGGGGRIACVANLK